MTRSQASLSSQFTGCDARAKPSTAFPIMIFTGFAAGPGCVFVAGLIVTEQVVILRGVLAVGIVPSSSSSFDGPLGVCRHV